VSSLRFAAVRYFAWTPSRRKLGPGVEVSVTKPASQVESGSPGPAETLAYWFEVAVGKREKYLAEGKELNFQAAPTGELAGKGRGPYKGKAKFKVQDTLGLT
jgi:hypothetical protein